MVMGCSDLYRLVYTIALLLHTPVKEQKFLDLSGPGLTRSHFQSVLPDRGDRSDCLVLDTSVSTSEI
jgi:hypothetical protein